MSLLAPKGICLFHLSLFKVVISVQCLKTRGLWAVTEPALTWWLPLPQGGYDPMAVEEYC